MLNLMTLNTGIDEGSFINLEVGDDSEDFIILENDSMMTHDQLVASHKDTLSTVKLLSKKNAELSDALLHTSQLVTHALDSLVEQEQITAQCNLLNQRVQILQSENYDLQHRLQDKENQLSLLHSPSTVCQEALQQTSTATVKQRINESRTVPVEQESYIELKEKIAALQLSNNTLQADVSKYLALNHALETDMRTFQANKMQNSKVTELITCLEEKQQTISNLELQIAESQCDYEQMRVAKEGLEKQVQVMKAALSEKELQNQNLSRQMDRINNECRVLQYEIRKLKNYVTELEDKDHLNAENIKVQDVQIRDLKSQIKKLEEDLSVEKHRAEIYKCDFIEERTDRESLAARIQPPVDPSCRPTTPLLTF